MDALPNYLGASLIALWATYLFFREWAMVLGRAWVKLGLILVDSKSASKHLNKIIIRTEFLSNTTWYHRSSEKSCAILWLRLFTGFRKRAGLSTALLQWLLLQPVYVWCINEINVTCNIYKSFKIIVFLLCYLTNLVAQLCVSIVTRS